MNLRKLAGQLLAGLRTWGLLAGLGLAPLPVAVVGWIAGAFDNPTISAVAFTLAACWAAIATVSAVWYRRRLGRARSVINNVREAVGVATKPSRWLPEGDPSRITLTQEDAEAALIEARRAGKEHLGEDAETWFDQAEVFPVVDLQYSSSSATADKTLEIHIAEAGGRAHRLQMHAGVRSGGTRAPNPLATDARWRILLRKSWLREGPRFKGTATLHYFSDEAGWQILYTPGYEDNMTPVPPSRWWHLGVDEALLSLYEPRP